MTFLTDWTHCEASFYEASRSSLDASSHLYKRVCPSVRLSIRPSVCPSICPSIHPSARLSVCPSIRPSISPLRMFQKHRHPSYRDADGASSCPGWVYFFFFWSHRPLRVQRYTLFFCQELHLQNIQPQIGKKLTTSLKTCPAKNIKKVTNLYKYPKNKE